MKEISYSEIKEAVKKAIYRACYVLNAGTLNALKEAREKEDKSLAKEILSELIENAEIAEKEAIPLCQDTGIVTCIAKVGKEVHLSTPLDVAVNDAVKEAYGEYYLRKSVCNPLTRINTKDNTPALIHTDLVEGDELTLYLLPKGAGSENMSQLKMLNPSAGTKGITDFIVQVIKEAGGKACPPLYLGIGIGGNFETSALLSKEALATQYHSDDPEVCSLAKEIKEKVNQLNIGPMGLGGKITCLDVFIKTMPCHIASLPVAVNIQCHANRVEVIKL